jgi:hypothetical protein
MRLLGKAFLIVLLICMTAAITARADDRAPRTTPSAPVVSTAVIGSDFVGLRSEPVSNTQQTRSHALPMYDTYGGYCYVLDAHYFTRDAGDQVTYRKTTTCTPANRIQLKHADINQTVAR